MPLITRNIVKSSARVQSECTRDVISVRYVTHLRLLLAHTNADGWQELGLPIKLTICERFIIYNVVYGKHVHGSTRYRESINFLLTIDHIHMTGKLLNKQRQ